MSEGPFVIHWLINFMMFIYEGDPEINESGHDLYCH